jgi:hypothetical protein
MAKCFICKAKIELAKTEQWEQHLIAGSVRTVHLKCWKDKVKTYRRKKGI